VVHCVKSGKPQTKQHKQHNQHMDNNMVEKKDTGIELEEEALASAILERMPNTEYAEDAEDPQVVPEQTHQAHSNEAVGSDVKANPHPDTQQTPYQRIEDIPFNDPSYTIGIHRRRLVMLQTLLVDQYENITMELALLDNALSAKQ
jgi:hypothetical protein